MTLIIEVKLFSTSFTSSSRHTNAIYCLWSGLILIWKLTEYCWSHILTWSVSWVFLISSKNIHTLMNFLIYFMTVINCIHQLETSEVFKRLISFDPCTVSITTICSSTIFFCLCSISWYGIRSFWLP